MKKGFCDPCRFAWTSSALPTLLFTLFVFGISDLGYVARAQPGIEWVKSISGNDYNAGSDIAIDATGHVFIAGVYRDQIYYDNNPEFLKSNRGKTDISIAKTDAQGNLLWMRTLGGPGDDRVFRIAVDAEGNVLITGTFEKEMVFDGSNEHVLESAGKSDMFLAKYGSDGVLHWSVSAGGEYTDQGIGLTCDDRGNVYVSGFFQETASWDVQATQQIQSVGQQDLYVARYTKGGELDWVSTLGGDKRDVATGVAVNEAGQIYVSGVTRGFSPELNRVAKGAHAGKDDFFLARFSDLGQLEWLSYGGGTGFDAANSIDIDDAGNLYITGYFDRSARIVDQEGNEQQILGYSYDVFLSKFDGDGRLAWIRSAGGELWDNAYDVHVDELNGVYVTGLFRGAAEFIGGAETSVEGRGEANAFVAKYGMQGDFQGLQIIDGEKSEGFGVSTDKHNNIYLTGFFVQEALFDDDTISLNSNFFNSFIAKYEAGSMEAGLSSNQRLFENQSIGDLLGQNFPNPFSTRTHFEIQLQEKDFVRIAVYDALGRLVEEVVRADLAAGIHRFPFEAGRLAEGVYHYSLETSSRRITRAMTVIL